MAYGETCGNWKMCFPDLPSIDADLWVAAGSMHNSGPDECLDKVVKICTAGVPLQAGALFTFQYDEFFYSLDSSDNPFPSADGACLATTLWRVKCVECRQLESTNEFDIEISLESTGILYEFTLTFPNTEPHTSQTAEVTMPESPVDEIAGSKIFSFGTDMDAAIETNELKECDDPYSFTWFRHQSRVVPQSSFWTYINSPIEYYSTPLIPNGCGYDFDFESETYRIKPPNPCSDEFRQYTIASGWSSLKRECTGGSGLDVYSQAGVFTSGFTELCDIASQWRSGTTNHFCSTSEGVIGAGATSLLTDLNGSQGNAPCGKTRFNITGCNQWEDGCDSINPNAAIMASWSVEGGPESWSPIYWINTGPANPCAFAIVEMGRTAVCSNVVYGAMEVKPFPSFPFDPLPTSALQAGWGGAAYGLPMGMWMELRLWCPFEDPTKYYVNCWCNGGMGLGIKDHPQNPLNIEWATIGSYNQIYEADDIATNCLSKGTHNLTFSIPYSVRQYDSSPPGFGGNFPVNVTLTLY